MSRSINSEGADLRLGRNLFSACKDEYGVMPCGHGFKVDEDKPGILKGGYDASER